MAVGADFKIRLSAETVQAGVQIAAFLDFV